MTRNTWLHGRMTGNALEYLAAGAKLVWIVDPESERVVVHQSARDIAVRCRVGELFE